MKIVAVLATLALLAAPLAAEAQTARRVWRIGVISTLYSSTDDPPQAFRQRLRDLGYVEGQNLTIEWRTAERGYDRLPDFAAEFVRLNVDLIVADVTLATRAAMRATPTIPIVMALAADAVGNGLVSSLARPGANVTGISLMLPEVSTKRLQLLKDALPKASRVAVLWNPTTPWHTTMLKEVDAAAPTCPSTASAIVGQRTDQYAVGRSQSVSTSSTPAAHSSCPGCPWMGRVASDASHDLDPNRGKAGGRDDKFGSNNL